MRTEGNGGSPTEHLAHDRLDVWQGWTVRKRRYACGANHGVEFRLGSCLDIRVKNHDQEEYRDNGDCLKAKVRRSP